MLPADEFFSLVRKTQRDAAEEAEPDEDYVDIDESDEDEY